MGLHELGSVFNPLIMVLGLDVNKVSITGMCNVTNLKVGQHQPQYYLNLESIESTAQIHLRNIQVKVLQR